MTSPQTTRCLERSAFARSIVCIVCFGVMILLNASDVFASCGDYLHSKSMRDHSPHSATNQQPQHGTTLNGVREESTSPPMQIPCQGPHCQKRDPSPLSPGSMPVKLPMARSMTEALLTPSIELDLVRQGVAYHEAAVSASEGFVDPLDRPPRPFGVR